MEFHSKEVKQIYTLFAKDIQPIWLEFITSSTRDHIDLLENTQKRIVELQKSLGNTNDLWERIALRKDFKQDILNLLDGYSKSLSETYCNHFYAQLDDTTNVALTEHKRLVRVAEPFHGYTLKLNENPIVTLRKVLANTRRYVVLLLKRLINPFRRLFRAKPLELVVYRKRRVLLRGIAKHFITTILIELSKGLVSKIKKNQCQNLLEIWSFDEKLDVNFQRVLTPQTDDEGTETQENNPEISISKLIANQQLAVEDIKKELHDIGIETFKKFDASFQLVDSLELPYSSFRKSKLQKAKNASKAAILREAEGWKNSQMALLDDWAVDIEITQLYYAVLHNFNLLHNSIESYIREVKTSYLSSIKSFIAKGKEEIEATASSKSEAKVKISETLIAVEQQLISKLLPKTTENLTGCFADIFDSLLNSILELVKQVSNRRGFIKGKRYTKGASASEINYISPRELLSFEALPVLRDSLERNEKWADLELEKAKMNLLGIGTVCDFTLESALIILDKKGEPTNRAIETAIDGFDRAIGHLTKAETILNNIKTTIYKEVNEDIHNFDKDIQKLKNAESILELNIRIARIKTIERTEELKQNLFEFVRKAIPKGRAFVGKTSIQIRTGIDNFKRRLGIADEGKYVSFELSEFLDQTQQSLKKLPFVYQRLYQLSPTHEDRFFVNRGKELEQLSKSLDDWLMDRFVTVALIGEKGSGITSLINLFLSRSNVEIEVTRHTLSQKIYTNDEYFKLLGILLGGESFETNEQIIEFINSSEGTRIIVLENLQHMFIKRVNGFDCKHMLFELMANTMRKVLWIGAYTTHSWNYLDRTIHISNYFTNEIYVEQMGQHTLEEIIFKRNRLSGYSITFLPSPHDLESKKFIKLNDAEKQALLKQQFFTILRQMSGGNISLAQLYWLRSTNLMNDSEIHIAPINSFDFSFVKNLLSDELFALQALILHDGLELNHFAMIMGKPVSTSRNILTPMLEKGLLIKPRMKYNINPIIFRPTVNYLTSRNFIN